MMRQAAPTDNNDSQTHLSDKERRTVVVCGAGPAGLLLTSLLLDRNNKDANRGVTYDVTLLDSRQDFASFTKQEMSEKHRSWMVGLSDHGMDAIKTLPTLYNNYAKGEGTLIQERHIFFGEKRMIQPIDEDCIVDRNYISAALANYLRDTHGNDPHYTSRYETKCQYVDYENRRILVRDVKTNDEEYLKYDLLVGCDGVRSTVREAIVKCHSDFSFEYTDVFGDFKGLHVKRPKDCQTFSIAPDIFPNCIGFFLPESGGMLNMAIGTSRNSADIIDDELKSDDYRVVADYVQRKFKAFELVDCEDFAKQWVNQRWNQTGMVHCNFYHSLKAGVVIMGDAAHATSPSIGMGMNTALRDAQIFCEILDKNNDNFEQAFPMFSEARVKEGNALTDLAVHLFCLDSKQQLGAVVHQAVRGFLYSKLPNLVSEHPYTMIGRRGVSLSECYDRAIQLGIMNKHRAMNDRIRREHFEQTTGMVQIVEKRGSLTSNILVGVILILALLYPYLSL